MLIYDVDGKYVNVLDGLQLLFPHHAIISDSLRLIFSCTVIHTLTHMQTLKHICTKFANVRNCSPQMKNTSSFTGSSCGNWSPIHVWTEVVMLELCENFMDSFGHHFCEVNPFAWFRDLSKLIQLYTHSIFFYKPWYYIPCIKPNK